MIQLQWIIHSIPYEKFSFELPSTREIIPMNSVDSMLWGLSWDKVIFQCCKLEVGYMDMTDIDTYYYIIHFMDKQLPKS